MRQFLPIGFEQQSLPTALGTMVYYTPTASPWAGATQQSPDRPSLIFFHSLGGGSSAYEWSKVYPAFAPDYRVIVPDLIGWGLSDHPAQDYGVEDYLKVMATLLAFLAPTPVVIAATSLTAAISIRLALQFPEQIQGLFLISPSGTSDFGNDYALSLPAVLARTPGVDQLLYAVGAANQQAVTAFLSTILYANPSRIHPETVAAYLAGTQLPNAAYSALASLKGSLSFDLARYLPQLSAPTVFVWGTESRFSSPEFGRRLARLNPNAVRQVYEVPDAGVLPNLEQPATVIALLLTFLRSLRNENSIS